MKIIVEAAVTPAILWDDLDAGDLFRYEGDLYMKISRGSGATASVLLPSGILVATVDLLGRDVTPVNGELRVDR